MKVESLLIAIWIWLFCIILWGIRADIQSLTPVVLTAIIAIIISFYIDEEW